MNILAICFLHCMQGDKEAHLDPHIGTVHSDLALLASVEITVFGFDRGASDQRTPFGHVCGETLEFWKFQLIYLISKESLGLENIRFSEFKPVHR